MFTDSLLPWSWALCLLRPVYQRVGIAVLMYSRSLLFYSSKKLLPADICHVENGGDFPQLLSSFALIEKSTDVMHRYIDGWYSPVLGKHMEIVTYGHYGFALLLLPTAGADYLEYERFQLINAIASFINEGKVKVFSINSINSESWLHPDMLPHHKAIRHNDFNHYVYHEVIPYIKGSTSNETTVITCGASLGALHSMNLFLKRPDLVNGVIAMSGNYDLSTYTKGFWNDDVYFNSPMHYVGNMHDHNTLEQIRASNHIHLLTGSGNYETPEATTQFSELLWMKSIPHECDIWGHDMLHDWPTWRAMLPHYLGTRF